MKKIHLDKLTIQRLTNYFDNRSIKVDQEVIYKGHIPHVGFLLLEGLIVIKNTRTRRSFKKGHFVGARELLKKESLKFSVEVKSGSKILILDKSGLMDLESSDDQLLKEIFMEFASE